MGFRQWSEGLDRRATSQWRRPYVAPLYLAAALAVFTYGALAASSPVVPMVLAAGFFTFALLSLLARSRDRKLVRRWEDDPDLG